MTKEELLALLPTSETEIRLKDAEGLPRFAFLNERDRFDEVQGEVFDEEEPWPNHLPVIGYEDFLGDLVCVDLKTNEVVIVDHETGDHVEQIAPSFEDWLQSER
ncbi:SMI1/KNR4 family protein [Exiguobacterium sp.]|uniref:SMI1/KNR4 family protein n=1 Tax=Exiguobacterium sp. TaxID=44751 RepID=UPI00263B3196|nr:SMI1/KNR4 family protein [Exiguobacterium sp.]MCC5892019.1 SMI1/KNR4 family protein [Exiguobacterium sp.]